MSEVQELSPLERLAQVLKAMDEGHEALRSSLTGLESEEAYLGSRWSVFDVLRHLNLQRFMASLEQLLDGKMEQMPRFPSREERLKAEIDQIEQNFQRFRSLIAGLSEKQLLKPATPPNPANSFPGLTVLGLLERLAGHESEHAAQIVSTMEYVEGLVKHRPPVTVVGVGPGDPRYVTPRTQELIASADYVAGFETALAVVRRWITGPEVILTYANQEEELARLGTHAIDGKRVVVCCYGDPSVSDGQLIARVRAHCDGVQIEPGISSVQLAAASCGLSLEETTFFSLHKAGDVEEDVTELVRALKADKRHVLVLPRPWDWMPAAIAARLIAAGLAGERHVVVLEKLSLESADRNEWTLSDLAKAKRPFSDLSIVVIPKEQGRKNAAEDPVQASD